MSDRRLIPKLPGPLGYSAALESLNTIAAPLLAGFAFTLIGLIVTSATAGVAETNLAVGLLLVAALLLITAIQCTFSARRYYVPPGEYLDLVRLGELDGITEAELRTMFIDWLPLHSKWLTRARLGYNAGIVVLLAGVAVALIPPGNLSHLSAIRVAAAGVAAAGAIVEALGPLVLALREAMTARQEANGEESESPPITPDKESATFAATPEAAAAAAPAPEAAGPTSQAPSNATDCRQHHHVRMPRWIFWVQLAWLVGLAATFVVYVVSAPVRNALPHTLGGNLPIAVPWFGAVGGCLISLTGIFDHNQDWDSSYDYWHSLRPLLGAITGGIGCLLLLVTTEVATKGPVHSDSVFYDGVAFVFGYAEAAFRSLIKAVTDAVLKPGS